MIKVILFDFYGLFLPDAYEQWLKNNGLKREGFYADIIALQNNGSISEREFLEKLSINLGRNVARSDIHSSNATLDYDLVDFVRTLKRSYKIGLLSNASRKLRPKLSALGVESLFDMIIISSEIGHAKPSKEAFDAALRILETPSSEVLFIDDNPANVESAKAVGIKSIRYTTFEETKQLVQAALQSTG